MSASTARQNRGSLSASRAANPSQTLAALKKDIEELKNQKIALQADVASEEKRRAQLLALKPPEMIEKALALQKENIGAESDIWCIRVGDSQGGRKDLCYHVRANSYDEVEIYRRDHFRYNSCVEDFELIDLRQNDSDSDHS